MKKSKLIKIACHIVGHCILIILWLCLLYKAAYCCWLFMHPNYDDALWAKWSDVYAVSALAILLFQISLVVYFVRRKVKKSKVN